MAEEIKKEAANLCIQTSQHPLYKYVLEAIVFIKQSKGRNHMHVLENAHTHTHAFTHTHIYI